jgi:hypothetical protein
MESNEMKVTVGKMEDGSWTFQMEGDNKVFVYNTKRAVLNAIEREVNAKFGIVKDE